MHSANKEKVKVEVFKINDPDGYSNLRDAPKGKVLQKVMDTESFEVVGEQAGYKKVKLSKHFFTTWAQVKQNNSKREMIYLTWNNIVQ